MHSAIDHEFGAGGCISTEAGKPATMFCARNEAASNCVRMSLSGGESGVAIARQLEIRTIAMQGSQHSGRRVPLDTSEGGAGRSVIARLSFFSKLVLRHAITSRRNSIGSIQTCRSEVRMKMSPF